MNTECNIYVTDTYRFKKNCIAFLNNKVNVLPVKDKKTSVKKRWFSYLVLEYKNEITLQYLYNNTVVTRTGSV